MNNAIVPLFHCHSDEGDRDQDAERKGHQRQLDALGIKYKSLHVGKDGSCRLNLSGTTIADLSPVKELPLTHLWGKDSTMRVWIRCFLPCRFHGRARSRNTLDVCTGNTT